MRRLVLFIIALSLHAATYYVASSSSTPAGSDSNPGSQSQPWLTLGHAVGAVACGDTITIVADGNYVSGDANIPYFPNCAATTTVQSSALANFAPVGFRTNPANDCPGAPTSAPCNYGKLLFTSQGILAAPEVHNGFPCVLASVGTGGGNLTITNSFCNGGVTMTNGSQIEWEINNGNAQNASALPTNTSTGLPLNVLQIYYVVNCSACNTSSGTWGVSATLGGPAIPLSCTTGAGCFIGTLQVTQTLQIAVAPTSTITILDTFGTCTGSPHSAGICTGTPIIFNSVGLQWATTTTPGTVLPSPLQLNTVYYAIVSGQTLQVSATPGGSAIPITSIGAGELRFSSTQAPNNWAFRGLEFAEGTNPPIDTYLQAGSGNEAGPLGMVNHFEVDRCWMHDDPTHLSSIKRGIADNGLFLNVHDSYLAGMRYQESQAIGGWASPGPTVISNNFMESNGETILYGGQYNGSAARNEYKLIQGNYMYKAPVMKTSSNLDPNTGLPPAGGPYPPSGSCWYDATDPYHAGGEWYLDTTTSIQYQCQSNFTWATTVSTPPNSSYTGAIKTMLEWKSGCYITAIGNFFNYNPAIGQSGQAFSISQEDGSADPCNDHNTLYGNFAQHVFVAMNFDINCNATVTIPCSVPANTFTFLHNVWSLDPGACGLPMFSSGLSNQMCGFNFYTFESLTPGITDMYYNHNTVWTTDASRAYAHNLSTDIEQSGPKHQFWNFKNSFFGQGDLNGPSINQGTVIANQMLNSTFANMVLPYGTSSGYGSVGATNTWTNASYPATDTSILFASPSVSPASPTSFKLQSSSIFSAACPTGCAPATDDGTDYGADTDLVNLLQSGAAPGTPDWNVKYGFRLQLGSTNMAVAYNRPAGATCSVNVYTSNVRNAAGQPAITVADSTGVIDGNSVRLVIPSLSASTVYPWVTVACTGGVTMMKQSVTTFATGSGTTFHPFQSANSTTLSVSASQSMSSPVTVGPSVNPAVTVPANSVRWWIPSGTVGAYPPSPLVAP